MEEDWACNICYQVLLNPVVGRCGHDYCRHCLLNWAEQCQAQGKAIVSCPSCRADLCTVEEAKSLGVCVRVKQHVEALFPEKLEERRREFAVQDAALRGVAAQRAQAQQRARTGRTRFIRARRSGSGSTASTRAPSPPTFPPSLDTHTAAQLQGALAAAAGISQAAQGLRTAGVGMAAPTGAASSQNLAAGSPSWVDLQRVCFTMGWWERAEGGRRGRSRGLRRV